MTSSNFAISKRRRTFIRLIGQIHDALNAALEEEHKLTGLTRADIAKTLGLNRSFITRKFTGADNMTIETLADLAFALNRPVEVRLPSRHANVNANDGGAVEIKQINNWSKNENHLSNKDTKSMSSGWVV